MQAVALSVLPDFLLPVVVTDVVYCFSWVLCLCNIFLRSSWLEYRMLVLEKIVDIA